MEQIKANLDPSSELYKATLSDAAGSDGSPEAVSKNLAAESNLLGVPGFDYDTSEAIRDELFGKGVTDLSGKLNNLSKNVAMSAAFGTVGTAGALERVTDVPIYFADAIARRSEPLLRTADSHAPLVQLPAALAEKLKVKAGDKVKVTQGAGSAILVAGIDARLPTNTVRVAAAHPDRRRGSGLRR